MMILAYPIRMYVNHMSHCKNDWTQNSVRTEHTRIISAPLLVFDNNDLPGYPNISRILLRVFVNKGPIYSGNWTNKM